MRRQGAEPKIGRCIQRTAEQDETFTCKAVHEGGMGIPIGLLLLREGSVPRVATSTEHGEQLHTDYRKAAVARTTRMKSGSSCSETIPPAG